ncbi:hypothetical protein X943_003533 [Babesia divergens]|uniref:Uncharacterized protein n=1 Tax=Babesia divergens TaxID=32595 RepID=A0AAD9GFV6_BABDI|nr:hypothetical protein X943_003533 [Babesia divergens]
MREIHDDTLLHTLYIDGQPDCLKLFPPEYQDATLSGTFLAATYEYDSHCKRRSGSIIAFNPCDALERYVKTGATIWNIESPTIEYYGASCITDNLSIVTLRIDSEKEDSGEDSKLSFVFCNELHLDTASDAIGLSLVHYDDNASLSSVTASDGVVYVVEGGIVSQKWYAQAHDMETWISAFHPTNPNIILTGADDSMIKMFDRRQGTNAIETISCFDKQMVRFDMRNMKTPLMTACLDTAIWYIDFMEDNMLHIAGCYDGAFVYGTNESGNYTVSAIIITPCSDDGYHLVSHFSSENSLIYGVAHIPLSNAMIHACCDFYNKRILFWN